ncbi:DegT/DnrJ/EryC1/StrS family aminotransferase [Leptolyngbya sp. PCC 6406]|uniref:DegT/DnrJ/EryC1/StrS family aminotransferase n=1 Tax=Leptolyngbya sp. PCC 6406 TaxID=1173264 RepID=UPI0002ABC27D|nr:DegT/DnrJ/EryC1/StrS family aminotransferase [Leptolyngbya sp. PCC 6406]
MNTIPPLDLTEQYRTIQPEVEAAVTAVLASGRYINGPVVEEFSRAFGDYIGTAECVACNSGTDALYLALRALDIGPGDEVITSPFTFIATTEVVSALGAVPVFIDIELDSFNLDPDQLEAAITPRTKAIMPVHLFGRPVDMDRVMAIAERHNLAVIEDCAQAAGAEWGDRKVGAIGHIGCFSFFPTKNLGGCGDGGALTTNDPQVAETVRMLREHGSRVRYYHEAIGVNSRLDALQAAILQIKLRHLEDWNAARQRVAERYQNLLAPIPGVVVPPAPVGGRSVWNQYTVRLEAAATAGGEWRDRVRQHLADQGVSSMIYYPLPLHHQPVYANLGYGPGSFPKSELAAQQVLALPMYPELTAAAQERVVYALKDALA